MTPEDDAIVTPDGQSSEIYHQQEHSASPAHPATNVGHPSPQSNNITPAESTKRKYSRNGCTECKRRRMKCDETKPKCWQCSRLGRECVYILNRKNKKRRTKAEMETEMMRKSESMNNSAFRPVSNRSNPGSVSDVSPTGLGNEFAFNMTDASLLYNDLNDLVNWRLEEALTPNLKTYIEEANIPFDTDLNQHSLPLTTDQTELMFNVPADFFNLGDPHNQYMIRYYNDFTTLSCPFTPNISLNPVRDVLMNYAKRETYLLYAILACGARIQHRESMDIRDDQAYCSYLSSCLNILSDNFEDEAMIAEKVEPMLLTILLLTTDCASSTSLRWRAHLKGAKELLKKTTVQSDTLNFCRNWLITYEVLAGMTNPYGGIFQSVDSDLDHFISNDTLYLNSLKKMNMIDVHGFNYIGGHIIQLDITFRDIMKILNRTRRLRTEGLIPKEMSHLDYSVTPKVITIPEWHSITNQLDNLEQMSIIDKSGYIPPSNPNHPSHGRVDGFKSIDLLRLRDGREIVVSWFDISHQTHIVTARVVFLTRVLEMPRTTVFIQELVSKASGYISFLNDIENYRNPCMTHLHMMAAVVGKCCIREYDQKLVEKFLTICCSMGLASAGHNLKKLQRIWRNEVQSDEEEDDVLTW
ncbi:CYFA0S08e02212g1_1 [Cyberlindnera fabianii]|uniref:CYFA0S08e02212g1_1 n=1 Tax=Cyberlindnera fabianii TaxID=36022 RepID=A0A061AWQ9_CYBFA|nr:CYFA0S08e02212g1_1 [Cyberlindnera fabianii]